MPGQPADAAAPQFAVVTQHLRQPQLDSVGRQLVQHDRLDHTLGERLADPAQVFLEAPDHDRLQVARAHLHAAGEPLRVQHLQQRGEAVGMAVVRRRREEKPVFEPPGDVAHGLGELAVDGVAGAAGRRGVVRLVQDQQGTRPEPAQDVAQPSSVGLVGQQPGRHDEARTRRPGVHPEPAQPPQLRQALPVDDGEGQAELRLQLVLPLQGHGWRRGHQREVDAAAQQQLAQDQTGLDRLPQANIVGDQEVDARQPQGLAQRQELVGIQPDAGTKWRLEQVPVGGGRGVPFQGAQVGREGDGVVGAVLRDPRPRVVGQCARADFGSPGYFELIALGIVRNAGQLEDRETVATILDTLHQPGTATYVDEVPDCGATLVRRKDVHRPPSERSYHAAVIRPQTGASQDVYRTAEPQAGPENPSELAKGKRLIWLNLLHLHFRVQKPIDSRTHYP